MTNFESLSTSLEAILLYQLYDGHNNIKECMGVEAMICFGGMRLQSSLSHYNTQHNYRKYYRED